jgi:putative NADPH-quinone reductase
VRAVVVLAHPDPHSFSHALAERACTALREAGHEVILHDLYGEGFRAVMSAAERHAYHGAEPVLDPLVQAHIDDVTAAEALVFVYPTWVSTLPAILKGWLERVMVPGVGFEFNAAGRVVPGLTHVRRIVGISAYGAPRRAVWLSNDNGRRTLIRAMRLSTGLRTRSRWLALYSVDATQPADRAAFLDQVAATMGRL